MIRVVVDDLAFVEADAVLRAADEWLGPASTAAARLDQLGGPRFLEQRRVSSPLEAGAAVVTGGGDLTAGFVLHLIVRDQNTAPGREALRRALLAARHRAADWGFESIATAPLGTGPGQLALEDAAPLLADVFCSDDHALSVTIVVENDRDREIALAATGGRANSA